MRDGVTMAEKDGQRSKIRAGDEEPSLEGRGSTIAKKLAKLRLLIWPEGAPFPLPPPLPSPRLLFATSVCHDGIPEPRRRLSSSQMTR